MPSRTPATLDEAIDWLRKHFDGEAARGVDGTWVFALSGPEGGALVLRVRDGVLDVRRGDAREGDALFRLSADDYFAVLGGRENADLLYMGGRIEIEGDLSRALKIRKLFRAD